MVMGFVGLSDTVGHYTLQYTIAHTCACAHLHILSFVWWALRQQLDGDAFTLPCPATSSPRWTAVALFVAPHWSPNFPYVDPRHKNWSCHCCVPYQRIEETYLETSCFSSSSWTNREWCAGALCSNNQFFLYQSLGRLRRIKLCRWRYISL